MKKGGLICALCERPWLLHTKEEKKDCKSVLKVLENTR